MGPNPAGYAPAARGRLPTAAQSSIRLREGWCAAAKATQRLCADAYFSFVTKLREDTTIGAIPLRPFRPAPRPPATPQDNPKQENKNIKNNKMENSSMPFLFLIFRFENINVSFIIPFFFPFLQCDSCPAPHFGAARFANPCPIFRGPRARGEPAAAVRGYVTCLPPRSAAAAQPFPITQV